MKIQKLAFENSKWNKFCMDSKDCWFYHTLDWIKYTLEYGGKDSECLSFYIEDGSKNILAICPLIRYHDKFVFSGSNGPNPALKNGLSNQLSKKLLSKVFTEIDSLASRYNISECLMSLTPLAENYLSKYTYNYLMKYKFENISLNTQLIDLGKDKGTLWSEIKKSHRNEINKGKNLFTFSILKPHDENEELFRQFKNLHYLAAGRMTRSDKTWQQQYEWIVKGNGVLINVYLNDAPVGGIFTILYKNGALYAVSANHPEYENDYSISHAIQWEMIKWLKYNRYKYYELGLQQFSEQPYDHPNKKDIDISLFKRHFGGNTITFHRGVKNYKEKNKLI